MAGLATALLWRRLDTAGAEHVLYSDRAGLRAKGTMVAAAPVRFVCRYELSTDEAWTSARCDVVAEGPGFTRTVRLERAAGRWRVTASEQGNLDAALRAAGHPRSAQPGCEEPAKLHAALDIDLGFSPLTNTLPIRRLGLHRAAAGTTHTIDVAWILVPSLNVVDSSQSYRALGDGRVQFTSGTFTAELVIDEQGYVVHYPGLAERG